MTYSTSHQSRLLLAPILVALFAVPASGQSSVTVGADAVSRYVWRGTDFGEAFSLQPSLAIGSGGFEIGSWASYSASPDGAEVNEHDLWVGYTVSTESSGAFSLGVTDYYFPAPGGAEFFNFDGGGSGAHWIEPYLSYTGPPTFPISLYGAVFVHNDPDNSTYLEASYPVRLDGAELGLTVGTVAGTSAFYGTEGFAIVNLGLSASKEILLNERISLPVSVSYILNPDAERTFLVFGVGVSL